MDILAKKKTVQKEKPQTRIDSKKKNFQEELGKLIITDNTPNIKLVNKGQYKVAFDLLEDAEACQLTPMLIGPPGTGKTLLARSFASSRNRGFEWLTLDESTKPAHLIGSFDPAETIRRGFSRESFLPGPLTEMMVFGGCFLANELNRATEFTQNSFLEPLEERSIMIPRLGRAKAHDDFFLICAANPADMAGTHRVSEALKDRIKVWITLDYPSRSVEMEIIKANIPQSKLSVEFMDLIYKLVLATRKSNEIERPASIRSAIAIAKLAGRKEAQNKDLTRDEFKNIVNHVLIGGVKPKPGYNPDKVVNKIITSIL